MAGTHEGGRKAAETNKLRYGMDYYEATGRKGGQKRRGGGFKMGSQAAREAGRKGGLISRPYTKSTENKKNFDILYEQFEDNV